MAEYRTIGLVFPVEDKVKETKPTPKKSEEAPKKETKKTK